MSPRFQIELGSRTKIAAFVVAVMALLLGIAASAQAKSGPLWTMTMSHSEEPLSHGGQPMYRGPETGNSWQIVMTNTGAERSTGILTFTDHLPAGVTLLAVGGTDPTFGMTCATSVEEVNNGAPLKCTETPEPGSYYNEGALPGESYVLTLAVRPEESAAPEVTNFATLTEAGGGNAPEASVSETVRIEDLPPFRAKTFEAKSIDLNEAEYTVAGGHQFETINKFVFPVTPSEEMKNAFVKLPAGYFANPAAAPRCPLPSITSYAPADSCPPGSQVGVASVAILGQYSEYRVPIYNVSPDRGYPAQFVFNVLGKQLSLYVVPLPRSESYGLSIGSVNNNRVGLKVFSAVFFGVPSEHGSGTSETPFASNPVDCAEAEPSWRLFLDTWENPGLSLTSGLPTTKLESGQSVVEDPAWVTATRTTQPVTGCSEPALASQFDPSLDVNPVQEAPAPQADQPSGLAVKFHFPQTNDPTDLSTVFNPAVPQAPELKTATVKLPPGLSISPSSSGGLEGCSDTTADPAGDQVHYDTTSPVACPLASKIGTATVDTPLLALRDPVDGTVTGPEPLEGEIFLVKPHPGDLSPNGDQDGTFRVLIQLEQPRYGVNFKLPGIITANKFTGQLTATFTENPQLPSSVLEVDFKQGPRAPLATPTTCGSFTTTSDLVPWSTPGTPDATPSSSFAIKAGPNGSACAATPEARPFNPTLSAGTESGAAGQSSPFVLHLTRNDGEQEFSSLELTAPRGFSATLKGVPYCSEADIASASGISGAAELANPSCPAASQIGSLTVGAGPGSQPFYATGKAYLAGPYKGAPLSVALITPAVAGPFDLGDVVVRTPLQVNKETTQVTIRSAPIPQILDGVPLRIHSIAVDIDRPGFTRNPTNCEAMAVTATVNGSSGASATPSNNFQAEGCAQLGFAPKLGLKLKGGTKRNAHPALTATVTYPNSGPDANIAFTSVTLPQSAFIDNAHLSNPCTRVVFAEGATPGERCPPSSEIGFARAETPLLDKPLEGPVYLRSSSHTLPDIVAALGGQIFVELDGRISSVHQRLRTTFETVPDAPISKFTLSLDGGKKGLLVNSENLCKKRQVASSLMTGQNGRVHNTKPVISNGCKKVKKSKSKKSHRHHGRHR